MRLKPRSQFGRRGAAAVEPGMPEMPTPHGEHPPDTTDEADPVERVEKRLRQTARWIERQLIIVALVVGGLLIVASFSKSLTDPFPAAVVFLVRHLAVGLVVAGLAAVVLPHLLKKDELKDILIDFVRNDVLRAIETQTKTFLQGAASIETIQRVGISRVYASRAEADADMARDLQSPSEIRVLGLSLNDLVGHNAPLPESWRSICRAITSSEAGPTKDVKVLLIDPHSLGATLRSHAEGDSGSTTMLKHDVDEAVEQLRKLQKEHAAAGRASFEFRLYRVAPQLFFCHTGSVAYVQPYYFHGPRGERGDQPPLPLFRCAGDDLLADLRSHFEVIWDFASVSPDEYLRGHVIGIEKGAFSAAVTNVYSATDDAAKRMKYVIHEVAAKKEATETLEGAVATTGGRVWLQGISLDSYFRPDGNERLYDAVQQVARLPAVDVRILLLHPYSVQAHYRAYREHLSDPLADHLSFAEYCRDQRLHDSSNLVVDTRRTINRIFTLNRPGCRNFSVKLYASAPFCFLLLTDDVAMVEQYHLGKQENDALDEEATILRKDMPIVEYKKHFERPPAWHVSRSPYSLLEDHFSFVWK